MDEKKQVKQVVAKIRKIRREKNISQMELALNSNLTQSFIANVEAGKKQPSLATVLKIANALGVQPRDFFDFQQEIDESKLSFTDMYTAFLKTAHDEKIGE